MTFRSAPLRVPISQRTPAGPAITGRKVIIGDATAFVTDRYTYLFRPEHNDLIMVCPFKPDLAIAADGWEVLQLDFYPIPGEA